MPARLHCKQRALWSWNVWTHLGPYYDHVIASTHLFDYLSLGGIHRSSWSLKSFVDALFVQQLDFPHNADAVAMLWRHFDSITTETSTQLKLRIIFFWCSKWNILPFGEHLRKSCQLYRKYSLSFKSTLDYIDIILHSLDTIFMDPCLRLGSWEIL